MKKFFLGIAILFILLIASGVLFFEMRKTTVTIDGHTFEVSVAKTPQEKEIGLSEKTSLSKDTGMLFPFDAPSYYSFWMKNMKIPIDIIFINKDHITTIYSRVSAPTSDKEKLQVYAPEAPSDFVLELPAGTSDTYHFQKGDSVSVKNL